MLNRPRLAIWPWGEVSNKVSQNLEDLTLGCFDERILGQLQKITSTFPKLKSLRLYKACWNRSNSFDIVSLLLEKFGSSVEILTIRSGRLICPNACFSADGNFPYSKTTLDLLEVIAARLHGKLYFSCSGLHDSDMEKFKLCLGKLDSISEIRVWLDGEQTALSLFLEVLAESLPANLQKQQLNGHPVLSAISLQKIQTIVGMIR